MHLLLNITLGIICAIFGILTFGFIGFELLGRTSMTRRRRWQMAGVWFALPAAIICLVIGYLIGASLVPVAQ